MRRSLHRHTTTLFALLAGLGLAQSARADEAGASVEKATDATPRDAHDATATAPRGDSVEVGYDIERGGYLRTRDGRWELNPYAMVQLQNENTWSRGEVRETTFSLHAAKLIMHGHVYDPSLTYHFQLNAGEGKVVAEDVYLRWQPKRELGFVVGQIEVPYNRQHITLEAYQELVARSSVDTRFSLQRDIGVAAYLSDEAHTFEWTSGIWNGARQNTLNDEASYELTTRLAWNPFGPIAFREADLAASRRAKLSLAVAGAYNPKRIVTDDAGKASTTRRIAQDVIEATLRWRGLSLTTEGHARRRTDDQGRLRIDYGTFFQVGQFVVPEHLQVVGRFAAIAGDLAPSDVTREETLGVSWYLHGHRIKVQADASNLEPYRGPAIHRARAQLQFFF